jgi:GNAT superfamily N-acetyltransferase
MIKELEVQELEDAAKIGLKFWAEGALPGSLKPEVFVRNWTVLLGNGMGKIFGLYEEGQLIGALGAIVVADLNDGELTATECFWFVDPASRGNGVRLLLNFVKYAKEIGCVRVNMVHLFNSHADKLSKLYQKLGFSPVETHYIKTF